jgi:hypothetical protein
MTAYNIVRYRIKSGQENAFLEKHKAMHSSDLQGMRKGTLIKTGDSSYCFIGEINKTAWSGDAGALLQARLGSGADGTSARGVGLAPFENLRQRAAAAQTDIPLVQAALAAAGRGDRRACAGTVRALRTQGRHRIAPG